jgi:hypothetical protein
VVVLIAMSPAGDTYIVQGPAGEFWVIQPEGLGGVTPATPTEVEFQIARRDLLRIDKRFNEWIALHRYINQRASQYTPETVVAAHELDAEDIKRLLRTAREWVVEGRAADALELTINLLRLPHIRNDGRFAQPLLDFLEQTTVQVRQVMPSSSDPVKTAAVGRWRQLVESDVSE